MEKIKKMLGKHLIMLSEQAEKNADNLEELLRISREMCNIVQTIRYLNFYFPSTASGSTTFSSGAAKVSTDINSGQINYEKLYPYPQYTVPRQINDTGNNTIS